MTTTELKSKSPKTRKGNGTSRVSRSSIACSRCHGSKVKCDFSIHGSPCSRCKERGATDCRKIQSRRGTYDREEWLKKVRARKQEEEHNHQMGIQSERVVSCQSPSSSSSLSSRDDSTSPLMVIEPTQDAAGYEELDWKTMLETFLGRQRSVVNKNPISYSGWSYAMSLLLQNSKPRNIDIRLESHQRDMASRPDHSARMTATKLALLASESCFAKPDRAVLNQFIASYLGKVHPVFPILDRTELMRLYRADQVPWLLLQSICFATVTHCTLDVLYRDSHCGSTRRDARALFYRRAKSLFDVGYEKDKITLIQSSILLSFWGGGQPHDCWNTFSWLNTAVDIAESLGMHRDALPSHLDDSEKALWRRIWWVLVVRDGFCAALLGKPLRINMSQCDVEHLRLDDFDRDHDLLSDVAGLSGGLVHVQGLYLIETTKLSLIFRDIISAQSTNDGVTTPFVLTTLKRLDQWRGSLPSCLNTYTLTSDVTILASALSLIYYYSLIYLHQMSLQCTLPSSTIEIAHDAVNQITEMGSTLVTRSQIADLPQDAFGSFFTATVFLVTLIRGGSGDARLHRMQLKVCEMIVHQAQEVWDHAGWILPLCDGLWQMLDEIPPSTTGLRTETEMEPLVNDAELDDFVSNLGTPWTPAVAPSENDVVESVASGALLDKGETELNMFHEMDELLNDLDAFSSVLGM
ncbi:fungal-specific transcription factor domain-containing protein [Lipomyces orientalis]|uniref:Fungal-specific transcription factor domain-containing protein n=1 Tax=Lipomyces orientalis TaxID=1233043 RepID=A0ACC3TKC2_9ASCO